MCCLTVVLPLAPLTHIFLCLSLFLALTQNFIFESSKYLPGIGKNRNFSLYSNTCNEGSTISPTDKLLKSILRHLNVVTYMGRDTWINNEIFAYTCLLIFHYQALHWKCRKLIFEIYSQYGFSYCSNIFVEIVISTH